MMSFAVGRIWELGPERVQPPRGIIRQGLLQLPFQDGPPASVLAHVRMHTHTYPRLPHHVSSWDSSYVFLAPSQILCPSWGLSGQDLLRVKLVGKQALSFMNIISIPMTTLAGGYT